MIQCNARAAGSTIMQTLAAQTTRFLLTTGVMQPMPLIRHFKRRTPCTSTRAIDRPCAHPMRAIMIAKSRFDTGLNIQYAATMLHARFVFFWCTSTSNITKTMSRGEHTRQHTWMRAFPVTMHFLHSCTPNFTPTRCNALQHCSPYPSSIFFVSEVSPMCSPLFASIVDRHHSQWSPKHLNCTPIQRSESGKAKHGPLYNAEATLRELISL